MSKVKIDYALIPDFENYMVGTDGSLWKSVKEEKHNEDYELVTLSNNGNVRSTSIHRLVAEAFIPNPDNLPEVNHINQCKYDNRVENLEWCTHKDNINHGDHNEKISKANSKSVLQYDMEGNLIKRYDSIKQAAEENGFVYNYLSLCCRGKLASMYGYIWMFEHKSNRKIRKPSKSVLQYTKNMKLIGVWKSAVEACEANGWKTPNCIRKCCDGNKKHTHAYGFIWRYKK